MYRIKSDIRELWEKLIEFMFLSAKAPDEFSSSSARSENAGSEKKKLFLAAINYFSVTNESTSAQSPGTERERRHLQKINKKLKIRKTIFISNFKWHDESANLMILPIELVQFVNSITCWMNKLSSGIRLSVALSDSSRSLQNWILNSTMW